MKTLSTKKEAEMEAAVDQAVRDCFDNIPGATLKLRREGDVGKGIRTDWIGEVDIRTESRPLIIEFKKLGQPKPVREAINSLSRAVSAVPNAYGIFVAPFISAEAGEILASEGVGFIDLAGNCRISFDNVFISREGRSNPFTEKRDLRSLYSPKAERVLRVLMAQPRMVWKVEPLAEAATVSLGQISNVKSLLESREWTRRVEGGFFLSAPGKLLDEWSQSYQTRRQESIECYTLESLAEIERRVTGPAPGGVLTAFSAAARLAPAVRYQRTTVYAPQGAETFISQLGLKRVTSGGNLIVIEPYDDGVFIGAQAVGDVKIVSPLQAYLDLTCLKGRGEEAAETLRRGVLERQW